MPIWRESNIEWFYASPDSSDHTDCEVVITGGNITLSYEDDGWVNYVGNEVAPGHFRLTAAATGGQISLYRFGDEESLVGRWSEGGWHGLCELSLEGAEA